MQGSETTAMTRPSRNGPPGPSRDGDWLSLTDLGRIYGISAVHTGKLLVAAGLRQANGEPSRKALMAGLAWQQHPGHHHQALWNREGCGPHLERQGVEPQQQRNLVGLWADLLTALQQGSPSIAVSAEPGTAPARLHLPGGPFAQERRSASACLLACSSCRRRRSSSVWLRLVRSRVACGA
jgi:hypothetical protein